MLKCWGVISIHWCVPFTATVICSYLKGIWTNNVGSLEFLAVIFIIRELFASSKQIQVKYFLGALNGYGLKLNQQGYLISLSKSSCTSLGNLGFDSLVVFLV